MRKEMRALEDIKRSDFLMMDDEGMVMKSGGNKTEERESQIKQCFTKLSSQIPLLPIMRLDEEYVKVLAERAALKTEVSIKFIVNPKPKWLPTKIYNWLISRLLTINEIREIK